ncbi:putative zinc finger A20 and AN1 domain-containing stress-associated protein 8-like [Capsicum annuum]|nr:putative zinc finger A20 and AN1 domain-containing stress-associated protein 8-like [Capsicum annuum]
MRFAKSNGLMNRNCEMILKGEVQRCCSVWLGRTGNHFGIIHGWTKFRAENGLQVGDVYKFELIKNGEIPIAHFHCDTLRMEETMSQAVDSNEMENMRVTLEAMTQALERLSTEVGAIRGEVTTISGRNSSATVTLETWPQLPNPSLAPLNTASQTTHNPLNRDSNRPTHSQTPQVPQQGLGQQMPPQNPNPPFQASLNQRPPPPQNPIPPNQVPDVQNRHFHLEEYGREDYEVYGALEMRGGRMDPRRY